jgi:hypothetical protein
MLLNRKMNDFILHKPELGTWDLQKIIEDASQLFETKATSWSIWQETARVHSPDSEFHDKDLNDCNLTYGPHIGVNPREILWKYSGIARHDIPVTDNDMYVILPDLKGTYLGDLLAHVGDVLGVPIRARLQNRIKEKGLYWHMDRNRSPVYHLALWTNPGWFTVWSRDYFDWQTGFDPRHADRKYSMHAEYIPSDGSFYMLRTDTHMHGVAGIGVGWRERGLASRCHLSICPVDPSRSRLSLAEQTQ